MKAKILLKDYKKSLENFKEYSDREYYNLCKEISKDIKKKLYNCIIGKTTTTKERKKVIEKYRGIYG